jgi:4'-phosphopantetheinyl transferase
MYSENLTLPFPISLESIPYLWQQSDVLIFLVNVDNYDRFSTNYLNKAEMKSLERLQTSYFQKRYIISRTVLKHILCDIVRERSASRISTYKDGYGRVCIHNHSNLYICISYTQSIAVLAISQIKIGIDVEFERTLALKSNLRNLSTKPSSLTDESVTETDLLKMWTLKEAYSKFSNKNMHLIFSTKLDLRDVSYSVYFLDNKYLLSVITPPGSHIININYLQKIDCNWD